MTLQYAARSLFMVIVVAVLVVSTGVPASSGEAIPGEVQAMLDKMEWLGHDCFKVEAGGKVIYTDPFRLGGGLPKADLILVTHEHYDHCSPEDIAKIAGPDTAIVSPGDCDGGLKGGFVKVKPGDRLTVKGVDIEAVPSYNTNKKFHPKANDWVGYIFTLDGTRIYIAGDTDYIPEMKGYRCDIALLPVSGTYVMTAEEAVKAADDIKPAVAVPMHYGSIVGDESDAERFMKLYKGNTHIFKKAR